MQNLDVMGKWAFLIGLFGAIIAGLIIELDILAKIPYLTLILVILGLIVGFLNITEKNVIKLLVAIIALISVGSITIAQIPAITTYLTAILQNIITFSAAVGLVVAIKAIYETSRK